MKKFLILATLLLCQSGLAEIVEVGPGQRVLHVRNLNYPPSTTLAELLDLFPELLAREGDSRLANYDLQIGGVSCGKSRDAALIQYQVSDIKDIIISQSPDMTQQQNGQGGVISVILNDAAEGTSGSVALKGGLLAEVLPVAKLNWRKKNFLLRSSLMLDYLHPLHNTKTLIREIGSLPLSTQNDTVDGRYGHEHAKVTIDWTPDSLNAMSAWVWQNLTKSGYQTSRLTDIGLKYHSSENGSESDLVLTAGVRYSHNFKVGSLTTQLEYNRHPGRNSFGFTSGAAISEYGNFSRSLPSALSGFTRYSLSLLPEDSQSACSLTAGLNYKLTNSLKEYSERLNDIESYSFSTRTRTGWLSPYTEVNSSFGRMFLKGGVRFHGYTTDIRSDELDSHNHKDRHLTAFLNYGWKISDKHVVSLSADRSMIRPEDRQIYPVTVYDPSRGGYVCGNPDLTPLLVHDAVFSYKFNTSNGGNDFVVSTSLQYINVKDVICSYIDDQCLYWKNDGHGDILNANFTTWWRVGHFSLNFNANLFQNWTVVSGAEGNYFYYNLSLIPMYATQGGFRVTPKIVYNSHIQTQNSRLSDCFLANLALSKTWKKLTLSADLSDLFHKVAEDTVFSSDRLETVLYNLHNPDFALSVFYSF